MRGGISNICDRYGTSNHPSMDRYNENEELRTLTYQDFNSQCHKCFLLEVLNEYLMRLIF